MTAAKNDHRPETAGRPEDLSQEDLARFIVDMFHRIVILHGLWFIEAARQFGMPKALDILKQAWPRSCGNRVERLGKTIGFETACIACPPDPHPEEWFCSWRFSIKNKKHVASSV